MSERIPEQNHQITLNLRCGSCIYFKELKYKKYKDVCSNLGIVKQGRPCKAYLNNAHAIPPATKIGKEISSVLSELSPQKLEALASLVKQEKTTRKYGFQYGQTVYVKIYPSDYVSNYAIAKIVQVTKEFIFVSGKNKSRGMFLRQSVLTKEEWAQKRKSLEKRRRIVDPNLAEYTKVPKNVEVEDLNKTISMIDLVEQEKFQKKEQRKVAKDPRKTELSTLINLRG